MLVLEDGTVFGGESVGATGFACGEAVFTTAMTGYQEIVTDPSFAEQLVCFTAPMIGNYGVDRARSESTRPHARAVLMREARGPGWTDWLHERGIVALTGIDTRSLVLQLRSAGAMRAVAVSGDCAVDEALATARSLAEMNGRALVAGVSTKEPYIFSDIGPTRVAVVDYGCKRSILRRLAHAGAAVTVYPHDVDADELVGYDGVLLSNGPGDPEPLELEIATVPGAARPGARARNLPRAPAARPRHGPQHLEAPVRTPRREPSRARAVERSCTRHRAEPRLLRRRAATTPEVTHVSLYDGTVEGLAFPELRARSLQFHPEAGPGPHDAWPLLETWIEDLAHAA